MSKFSLMFGSRTFWLAVALFLYTGLVGVVHLFPSIAWVNDVVAALAFVLVNYFHVNPSQNYNQ